MISLKKHLLLSLLVLIGQSAEGAVLLTSFGNVGNGGDDTRVFQNALNSTAAQRQTLQIPAGTYNVRPLYFPTNSTVVVSPNVAVQAVSGFGQNDRLLNIEDVQNVSITGTPGQSIFRMRKSEYTSGEYRHCLSILGSTNVLVSGIQCNASGGDGLYIGEGSRDNAAYIQVQNSGFDNNRRQGMSIISAQHVAITNCTFTNTSGTDPSSGIDIEPNRASNSLVDIVIQGGSATGNAGNGVTFGIERLNASSTPVSITVSNFTTQANRLSGYFATNEPDGTAYSVPGRVLVTGSSSIKDRQYGAVASYWEAGGTALVFQNLTVTDPNQWHNNVDNAAVAVKRGGGGTHLMGNVTFTGTSITSTTGSIDTYFTIWDWSYVGVTQVQFINSRQLSGAKLNTSLLYGRPTSVINIP